MVTKNETTTPFQALFTQNKKQFKKGKGQNKIEETVSEKGRTLYPKDNVQIYSTVDTFFKIDTVNVYNEQLNSKIKEKENTQLRCITVHTVVVQT